MRVAILSLIVAFVAIAFACDTPPQWEGRELRDMPGRGDVYRHIHYDATGERIAYFEDDTSQGRPERKAVNVLLFKAEPPMEYVVDISSPTDRCEERPLRGKFVPLGVPASADYATQFSIGLEDAKPDSGLGLEVTEYEMNDKESGRRTLIGVTKVGCIPVSVTTFEGAQGRPGYSQARFFNITAGIMNPGVFEKPKSCK